MRSSLSAGKSHPVWVYICGFNIAILVGVFMAVARPLLSPRRTVLIAIAGLVIYTRLVGAGASVVRATIMAQA